MLNIFKRLAFTLNAEKISTHNLDLIEIPNFKAYLYYSSKNSDASKKQRAIERELARRGTSFVVTGYCIVCQRNTDFIVDYKHSYEVDGMIMPNWRERLVCPGCNLNNRLRAAIQIFKQILCPKATDAVYITEQTTPFYKWLRTNYMNLSGSEYLGGTIPFGQKNSNGIRNEDCTALTFENGQLDHILSFDVLEHIVNYKIALKEFHRCLKRGGKLLLSVPFEMSSRENIVRAKVDEYGNIEHILPAEYHGDPVNSDGCLCYYHFGWQLLEDLRDIGFTNAKGLLYWSRQLGYLGKEQVLFVAQKR